MIDQALALCEQVGVLIGSPQESGTGKNPFTYEMRESILKKIYGDRIRIFPLPDIGVGNNSRWGEYVIDRVIEYFGEAPDLLISGKEDRRTEWFDGERGRTIAELYVPKTIDISASRMRKFLVNSEFETWKEYCDERLWADFPEMRKIVLESADHQETASI